MEHPEYVSFSACTLYEEYTVHACILQWSVNYNMIALKDRHLKEEYDCDINMD